MYIQKQLAEDNTEILHEYIKSHSFGTLIISSPAGVEANHIPFELITENSEHYLLRAHVSLSNPAWKLAGEIKHALVIFQGPHSYISPSLHPARNTHGKVAPSWNYSAVHAYGAIEVVRDPEWLHNHLDRLVIHNEANRKNPWSLTEAPQDFIDTAVQFIVGLEIKISHLYGKFQASQQYSASIRESIADGLRAEGNPEANAVAEMILSRKSVHEK